MISSVVFQSPDLLLAASQFTDSKDIRTYVGGVRIETTPQEVFVVATDGTMIFVGRLECSDLIESQFTIPLDLVKGLKAKGAVVVSYVLTDGTVTVEQCSVIRSGPIKDNSYPDWRRVVPKEYSAKSVQYSLYKIATLAKAAKILGSDYPYITPNGNAPGYVDFCRQDCFGCIMPMRGDLAISTPEWF